jgi:hypothetical protein
VVLYCEKIGRAAKELNPKKEKPSMDNFRKIVARYNIPVNLNLLNRERKERCGCPRRTLRHRHSEKSDGHVGY